jgi:hypothetical protein
MATTDTLSFGIQDVITGKPTIDGLVDYDMLPYNGTPEVGYTNGSKLTYEGGTFPRVVFQGVHQTIGDDRLVLGFMCRFDVSFDTDDFIVILFRQSAGSSAGPRRMILIRPNLFEEGAGPGNGDPMFPGYEIKRNQPPNEMHFYKEFGGPEFWDEYSPPAGQIDVKVRSWKPGRFVDADPECCWSVEVSVPRTAAGDWIALNNDFGLYFNVVRINNPAATVKQSIFPTTNDPLDDFPGANFPDPAALQWGHGLVPNPGDPVPGVGVHFIGGWQGVGRRPLGTNDPLTGTIEGGPGGTDNAIVALIENTGEVPANDVSAEFRFRNYGLPPDPELLPWDKPFGMTDNPTAGANLAATNGTAVLTATWLAANVDAGYAAHPDQCFAVTLSSPNDVNFNQAAVRRNMWVTQLSEVEKDAEISGEGYPEPADGSGQVDFLLETFCRQINVAERLSEKEVGNPEITALVESVVAAANPDRGGEDVPRVVTHTKSATAPQPGWKNSVVYVWMTIGSRRTGTFMNIEGRSYEILDETPGEFGIAAYHEGLQDKLSFSFDGPGLVQYAPGSYGLKVPWKSTTTIKVKLGAGPEGPGGDVTKSVPREPWPKPRGLGDPGQLPDGCRGMLKRLLGMLLKRVFGKKS